MMGSFHSHPELTRPSVRFIDIHDIGCPCVACEPYVPSVPSRLTAVDMGKRAVAGAFVGWAITFVIDPTGAAAALLATIAS